MGMMRLIYKSRLVDGYGEIVEYVAFLLVFRDEIHLPVRLIECQFIGGGLGISLIV
jgi:hypothetical protein